MDDGEGGNHQHEQQVDVPVRRGGIDLDPDRAVAAVDQPDAGAVKDYHDHEPDRPDRDFEHGVGIGQVAHGATWFRLAGRALRPRGSRERGAPVNAGAPQGQPNADARGPATRLGSTARRPQGTTCRLGPIAAGMQVDEARDIACPGSAQGSSKISLSSAATAAFALPVAASS